MTTTEWLANGRKNGPAVWPLISALGGLRGNPRSRFATQHSSLQGRRGAKGAKCEEAGTHLHTSCRTSASSSSSRWPSACTLRSSRPTSLRKRTLAATRRLQTHRSGGRQRGGRGQRGRKEERIAEPGTCLRLRAVSPAEARAVVCGLPSHGMPKGMDHGYTLHHSLPV